VKPQALVSIAVGVALALAPALVLPPAVATAATVKADAKQDFIDTVAPAAQAAQRQYGVPASVSIAQAALASEWGTSKLVKKGKNYFNVRCGAAMTATQFAALAEDQVGKPYVLGAEAAASNPNPPKFDCSELVEWLYARSGNRITDLAAAQYDATKKVAADTSPAVGDLVFLRNNPARSNGIGHVAVLTKKLDNGDWRIIEAKGRAYGVVRTTLSYWKTRDYYAGLRRSANLVFAGQNGTVLSTTGIRFQSGCIGIKNSNGKTIKYSNFSTIANSFADHAATVLAGDEYTDARGVLNDVDAYIDAVAKAEQPDDAANYAASLRKLVADHHLVDYDVVPFTLVLVSGDSGAKVSALQYLLRAASRTVKINGSYDAQTVKAVKSFQTAKSLLADGEAGPKTFAALIKQVKAGTDGDRTAALNLLLEMLGYASSGGDTYGTETTASVKQFQADTGLSASGTATVNTFAKLFMAVYPAPVPVVAGETVVLETLTATAGSWGPGKVTLGYQWYRNGSAISGATAKTYDLQPADAGQPLTVAVTGTKAGYTGVTRSSRATAKVATAPLTTTPVPTVSGTPTVDATLTATAGKWAPSGVTLGYQWQRDGEPIDGATKATYLVQGTDAGKPLTVQVTGTKAGYTTTAKTSAATAKVAKATFAKPPTPKITGTVAIGATLGVEPGTWAAGKVTFGYQWYRGDDAIDGATQDTYTVQEADGGAKLTVEVTGIRDGYTSASRTSAATDKVLVGSITAGTAKVTGKKAIGQVLQVKPGTWGPGKVTLTYQWYHASKPISGATKATYKVKAADKGHTVKVRIRGARAGYLPVVGWVKVSIR
jgi:cell wall-associated NlpC family hydrolase/peptidoglycan hydrolase-like protein with peptidoglycan-binding domain